MRIKSFIFNWKDWRENALHLESQLRNISDVTVISSTDNGYTDENWSEIGEDKYFVGQWNKALSLYDPTKYDIMFHVQADAHTDQLEAIINKAISVFDETQWGVYAPHVDYSAWDNRHILEKNYMDNEMLHRMGGTDCTCWMIHNDVVIRIPASFDENLNSYGFGIDILYFRMCKLLDRPALRDYNFVVDHPKSKGYPGGEANSQAKATAELYKSFITKDVKWQL